MGGTLISAWTGAAGMLSPRRLRPIRVLPRTTLLGSSTHGGVRGLPGPPLSRDAHFLEPLCVPWAAQL